MHVTSRCVLQFHNLRSRYAQKVLKGALPAFSLLDHMHPYSVGQISRANKLYMFIVLATCDHRQKYLKRSRNGPYFKISHRSYRTGITQLEISMESGLQMYRQFFLAQKSMSFLTQREATLMVWGPSFGDIPTYNRHNPPDFELPNPFLSKQLLAQPILLTWSHGRSYTGACKPTTRLQYYARKLSSKVKRSCTYCS